MLAACGWQINTAFVERLNLSLRQPVAAIGRRVSTRCKGEDAVVRGSSQGRRPEQAPCVHTAGFEGVTRGARAAGRP